MAQPSVRNAVATGAVVGLALATLSLTLSAPTPAIEASAIATKVHTVAPASALTPRSPTGGSSWAKPTATRPGVTAAPTHRQGPLVGTVSLAVGVLAGAVAAFSWALRRTAPRLPPLPLVAAATAGERSPSDAIPRRHALTAAGILATTAAIPNVGFAAPASPPALGITPLCDARCLEELASRPRIKTPSGLEYQDIVVGSGPSPQVGYQCTFNLVAMLPSGRIFSNTLADGNPLDQRVGSSTIVKGLDEGLQTMQTGGIRRLYVPSELSYQSGLKAAPGQPAVPPRSPLMFDVQLLLVPGLEGEGDGADDFASLLATASAVEVAE
jgi:peptidylprolyl isomerase